MCAAAMILLGVLRLSGLEGASASPQMQPQSFGLSDADTCFLAGPPTETRGHGPVVACIGSASRYPGCSGPAVECHVFGRSTLIVFPESRLTHCDEGGICRWQTTGESTSAAKEMESTHVGWVFWCGYEETEDVTRIHGPAEIREDGRVIVVDEGGSYEYQKTETRFRLAVLARCLW